MMARLFVTMIGMAIFLGITGLEGFAGDQHPQQVGAGSVERKAKAATHSNPQSVRALIDEIFDRSILSRASEHLRDRVYRTDLQFRSRASRGISEGEFVSLTNSLAAEYAAPDF